jgi:hypothetical protein
VGCARISRAGCVTRANRARPSPSCATKSPSRPPHDNIGAFARHHQHQQQANSRCLPCPCPF